MSKHTPGPWSDYNLEVRSGPNPDCQKWPTGRLIADCYHTPPSGHFDGGENAANARLIAASPEMRNLLQDLVAALSQQWLPDGDMDDLKDRARELLNKIDKDPTP